MYVDVCLHVCLHYVWSVPLEARRGHHIPWNWNCRWLQGSGGSWGQTLTLLKSPESSLQSPSLYFLFLTLLFLLCPLLNYPAAASAVGPPAALQFLQLGLCAGLLLPFPLWSLPLCWVCCFSPCVASSAALTKVGKKRPLMGRHFLGLIGQKSVS